MSNRKRKKIYIENHDIVKRIMYKGGGGEGSGIICVVEIEVERVMKCLTL